MVNVVTIIILLAISSGCFASDSFSGIYEKGLTAYRSGDCEKAIIFFTTYLELTNDSIPKEKLAIKKKIENAVSECEEKVQEKNKNRPLSPTSFRLHANAIHEVGQEIAACDSDKCKEIKASISELEQQIARIDKIEAMLETRTRLLQRNMRMLRSLGEFESQLNRE